MANPRQSKRLFTASILGLSACTAFLSIGFLLSAEAAVQKPEMDDLNIPKIDLLLSGGGLRASAFAYGVLAGLNEICIDHDKRKLEPRKPNERGELERCKNGPPLLDQINIISAVSGGAITAAYFKTHRGEFFEEFPRLLKRSHLERRLLTTSKPFSLKRILRTPVFLFTSILDTAFIPLSMFNLNIEFTPVAVMWLSDGLLESQQLANVYNDLFYENTRLEALSNKNGFPFEALARTGTNTSSNNNPALLINATDIANGTVFTFDERTFDCMGIHSERGSVELALAVAASSSLPGVFSPVQIDDILERADPRTIPTDCPAVLANRSRKPVLLDGGITDNLGVIGLLREVIREKEGISNSTAAAEGRDYSSRDLTQHDPRARKHLLFIVNAEAESDAKLPGLAGHFDASYDVLIRSKKDLVRVMASDMFNHFGFGTVELRISDLVTTEPGIQRIVSGTFERLKQGKIKDDDLVQVVPRAMVSTDQEQRVKRDLDQVGMLPTPDEVDTLIAVGRQVVFHRLGDLKVVYTTLSDKTFVSNCSGIANPDQYFCWPSQFRSHDLDSGGGSAFLQTLTELTKDFLLASAKEREGLTRKIKSAAREALRQEDSNPEEEESVTIVRLLQDIAGTNRLIQEDSKLEQLYEEANLHSALPANCKQALVALSGFLTREVSPRDVSQEQMLMLSQILDALEQGLERVALRPASCSPHYYTLKTFPYLYSKGGFDQSSKVISILLQGDRNADPRLSFVNYSPVLGMHLITFDQNFQQGLYRIKRGFNEAVEHEIRLVGLISRNILRENENVRKQIDRMRNAQAYWKLMYALYVPMSPIEIAAEPSEILEQEIYDWEKKHIPNRDGDSLLEALLRDSSNSVLDDDMHQLLNPHILAAITSGNKELSAVAVKLCWLHQTLHSARGFKVSSKDSCGSRPRDSITSISTIIKDIRELIRSYLAGSAGLAEAERYLRSVHSLGSKVNPDFLNYLESDILSGHGFLTLIRHMGDACPLRAQNLQEAKELFARSLVAEKTVLEFWRKEEANSTKTTEKIQAKAEVEIQKQRLLRLQMYNEFVGGLQCAGQN